MGKRQSSCITFKFNVEQFATLYNLFTDQTIIERKKYRNFWTWGNRGARANGGIYFKALVNHWELNLTENGISTKDYNKYYVTFLTEEQAKKHQGYKILVRKGSYSHKAFKNKEDFNKWIFENKIFKGEYNEKSFYQPYWQKKPL